jgi:hypothetical protein
MCSCALRDASTLCTLTAMWRRRGRSIVSLAFLGAMVSTATIAVSMAAGQDESSLEAELRAAFCGDEGVCRIVNTLADPRASDKHEEEPQGLPLSALLVEHGRPARACPLAATAYAATGERVDAFLGPCPSALRLKDLLP